MTKIQFKGYIEQMINEINEDMKTAFPGINVGSGAYIETDKENIEGCIHEDIKLMRPDTETEPGGDIAVAYDWCDDDLSKSQQRIFYSLYLRFFSDLQRGALQVAEADGSGNGLYYGLMLLRSK